MTEFYNPFHFVPAEKPQIDAVDRGCLSMAPGERSSHNHVTHDRYLAASDAFSGRIVCRLRLDSPTVVGAQRTAGSHDRTAKVEPYQVLAERTLDNAQTEFRMEPAIPGSSLRGMISSVFEAVTSSALRVLNDTLLSVRMAGMVPRGQKSDALQAVGMIHVDADGKRHLLPLSFPALERQQGGFNVPSAFWAYEGFTQVKLYLNSKAGWESSTPDNGRIYFLKTTSCPAVDAHRLIGVSSPVTKGGLLLARRGQSAHGGDLDLKTQDEWLALKTGQDQYVPGVLRNLGVRSSPSLEAHRSADDNRVRKLPGKSDHRHQWFIPLDRTVYDPAAGKWVYQDNRLPLVDAEAAARQFESLARDRTHADLTLPYELRGSLRNSNADKKPNNPTSHEIELRHGDLVCFEFGNELELAISSIWRRPAGSVWKWFSQIDPELVPMHSNRTRVTLAEQLFGFVEQDASRDNTPRVKALAGRVRFSSGRLCSPEPDGGYFDPPEVAQILAAPKPPSPQLYFHKMNGEPFTKRDFPRRESDDCAPLGRKVYLHHDAQQRHWETEAPEKDKKQKTTLRPLKQGLKFVFDVTFDNLTRNELALLVYSLTPTPEFRHRLGMGKPLGLGTVDVEPLAVFFVDRRRRYAEDNVFGAGRYHSASRCEDTPSSLDLTHAALDVQRRYAEEQAAWAMSQPGPACRELRASAVALLDKYAAQARAAVEKMGDPATTQGVPVHYPRLPDALQTDKTGTVRREARLYQWHVWNEHRPQPQGLQPLTKDNPAPGRLSKQAPFRFFLYSHLPDDALRELRKDLQKNYPHACYPASGQLASSTQHYDDEIKKTIEQGMIPVHLGVHGQEKINQAYLNPNYGAIFATKDGRPVDVVREFRRKYLPVQTSTE